MPNEKYPVICSVSILTGKKAYQNKRKECLLLLDNNKIAIHSKKQTKNQIYVADARVRGQRELKIATFSYKARLA